jgi:hypothetical protein
MNVMILIIDVRSVYWLCYCYGFVIGFSISDLPKKIWPECVACASQKKYSVGCPNKNVSWAGPVKIWRGLQEKVWVGLYSMNKWVKN